MQVFKLVSSTVHQLNGIEFTAEDDATEEEIAKAAADAAIEQISFGWEEVKPAKAKKPKRPTAD